MLLAPLREGMEQPPHPMRLGETEEDYYRLGLVEKNTSVGGE
jgi:NADH-quinone oxidoreductase subunit I